MPPSKPLTVSSRWLSALRVAFVTSITSASPPISRPALFPSYSLILYPLETSKTRKDSYECNARFSELEVQLIPRSYQRLCCSRRRERSAGEEA
jgi:hypothetical protein